MRRKETEAKLAAEKLKADSTRRISEVEAAHSAIETKFREATTSLAQTRQRLLDAEKAKAEKTRAAEEATRAAERLQVLLNFNTCSIGFQLFILDPGLPFHFFLSC